MIHVTIPGLPHGQGRPRAVRRGAFVGVHERPEDSNWKHYAQAHYREAMAGRAPYECAVHVSIFAVWPQPKATRKAERGFRIWRVGKPDADNLAKAVLDAGNGVLWLDDAQVAELIVRRVVGAQGEAPRVMVEVLPLPWNWPAPYDGLTLADARSCGVSESSGAAGAAVV